MATKNLPLSGAKRRSIPTEALGILVLIPYDNSGTSRSGLPPIDICEIEILLSAFLSSPGGVNEGASGPPLTPAGETEPGGLRLTLLLSGLLGLFSGKAVEMAGSDTFRLGLVAFGSCIKTRGPVAPISC